MFSAQACATLQNLGLEDAQIQGFATGSSVAFNLAGTVDGTVAVARLLPTGRLQVGIYTIRNVGGGLADFATFEARALAAARALGASEIEFMGIEVANSQLRAVLERGGFTPTTLPAPEELGGGTLDAISRIEPVSPF